MKIDFPLYLFGFGMGMIATSIIMNINAPALVIGIIGIIFCLGAIALTFFRGKA